MLPDTLLTGGSIRGERELFDVLDAYLRDALRHATAELGPARVTAGPNALRPSQERSIPAWFDGRVSDGSAILSP